MIFGLPLFVAVLLGLSFLAGVATIPILAYGAGGLLPAFLAEPIATGLFATAFLGIRDPVLEQTATGEYELRPAEDEEPVAYWRRWAFCRFAVAADLDEAAWGELSVNPRDVESEPISGAAGIAEVADAVRGGIKSFVEIGNSPEYYLPTGQVLSKFQHAGGLELAFKAASTAEKEHGGDTNQYSAKLRLMGHIVFAVLGAGMGFVFFVGGGV